MSGTLQEDMWSGGVVGWLVALVVIVSISPSVGDLRVFSPYRSRRNCCMQRIAI
mgnify:CR=1 FL=1